MLITSPTAESTRPIIPIVCWGYFPAKHTIPKIRPVMPSIRFMSNTQKQTREKIPITRLNTAIFAFFFGIVFLTTALVL